MEQNYNSKLIRQPLICTNKVLHQDLQNGIEISLSKLHGYCSMFIERERLANIHCQGIAYFGSFYTGLTSTEGQKPGCFK